MVQLRRDGKSHPFRIHKLAMLVFVGPRPKGLEVCHYDGDASNNYRSNLRYDTRLSNGADRIRHYRTGAGGREKKLLSQRQVKIHARQRRWLRWHLVFRAIRGIEKGGIQREIADQYGLCMYHLSRIRNGKYKIPDDIKMLAPRRLQLDMERAT